MCAASAAVVVVGLEIDAISAADFLTSRTRGLADAVDACLSGFTACPARAAVFSVCAFCVGLASVGFVTVVVAKVFGTCHARGEVEVGEIQAFSATQRKSFSTIGRACSFYASLTGGTRIATRSAMIVVHLNVYAISAADYLTSRTRSLADAVDAGFAGFTACPA